MARRGKHARGKVNGEQTRRPNGKHEEKRSTAFLPDCARSMRRAWGPFGFVVLASCLASLFFTLFLASLFLCFSFYVSLFSVRLARFLVLFTCAHMHANAPTHRARRAGPLRSPPAARVERKSAARQRRCLPSGSRIVDAL